MDRLRSLGGCPWNAAQTHVSLLRYLVEECYELVDAVESDDRATVREELGDVLLQVLFHARVVAETPRADGGFGIDGVAGDLVDKLVRRHPHVFGGAEQVPTAADQQRRWDELKKTQKGRSGPLDGVALGQPAAVLAAKLGARSAKSGVDVPLPKGESVGEQLSGWRSPPVHGGRTRSPRMRAVARAHAQAMADRSSVRLDAHGRSHGPVDPTGHRPAASVGPDLLQCCTTEFQLCCLP